MESLTNQVRGALADSTVSDVISKLSTEVEDLKKELSRLADNTAQLLKMEAEINKLAIQQDTRTYDGTSVKYDALYIINPITSKCHRALVRKGLPKFWRARCSWNYGLGHYETRSTPIDGYKDLCDACLHQLRVERKTKLAPK